MTLARNNTTHRKGGEFVSTGTSRRRRLASVWRVGIAAVVFGACLAGSGVAVAATTGAGLAWSGDLSTGNLSQYYIQACGGATVAPKGVTLVNSPVHAGWSHSMQFTISDQSITRYCPVVGSQDRPNANAFTPSIFKPGMEEYIGFGTFFPKGFPAICSPWVIGCYMQVAELYGQPFGGSSPVNVMVIGNRLVFASGRNGTVWTAPTTIPYGTAWQDIVLRVHFDSNPSVGFVELWYNGKQQKFTNGSTRFYEATLLSGVNWDGTHANYFDVNQYRGNKPIMGTTTLYHTGIKVGTSYASAAP